MIRYSGNKRSAGNPGGVDSFDLSEQKMGLPWDMTLYNPMLRGKKSSVKGMTTRGFGCLNKDKRCPMSMIYKDKNNQLYKILYGHA